MPHRLKLIHRPDFRRGAKSGAVVGLSFFAVFFGFGVFAVQNGMPAPLIPLFTALVFAAPAQYAVVDAASASPAVWHLILLGSAVNMRFFVMSMAMAHFTRDEPLKKLLPWAQFVAASTFLLPLFEIRRNPASGFFTFYRGVACAAVPMTVAGTLLGMAVARSLPPLLLFITPLFFPVYFSILLMKDVKGKTEMAAVAGAFALTPAAEAAVPGWGVLGAAFAAATVSLLGDAWARRRG